MLLSEQDPEDISRANQAVSKASSPVRERITRFDVNWNIIAWPGTQWAKRVFPNLAAEDAQKELANAIFKASRADGHDPRGAWRTHNANLVSNPYSDGTIRGIYPTSYYTIIV